MTRRCVQQDDLYEYSDSLNWSDGKSLPNKDDDKVFNVKADNNEDKTDLSDIDDFNPNDIDIENVAKLFEGNLYLQNTMYCTFIKYNPQRAFESITLTFLNSFFNWLLSQRTSKDRRKKRGTTKSSSLRTYWKVYQLIYERAMGEKLDVKLNRKMHRVLKLLAKKHCLSNQKHENRCITIDNLKEQVNTTLYTTKKSFGLGEL
ncbi:hypothetical protein B0T25DRAFT_582609 [Lasiosphaeria hispida]|uniref:Phage integrase SAM-like domain-containing protein n=1 Tax=Lasiosphaeria hispida TaxID=260671 RepID=A0AAJ0HFA1_9PEZI|nr:hypothetical protein B0T25DRAFT_582609 [Lasiosphaeria hispida]